VRMIRAKVRWWPGNVAAGGTTSTTWCSAWWPMMLGGVIGLATPTTPRLAAVVGGPSAWARPGARRVRVILHLRDVYWTQAGRLSVDAVFLAVGLTGLLLIGAKPSTTACCRTSPLQPHVATGVVALIDLGFAVVALLKGKILDGLLGLLLPPLAGRSARCGLARPNSAVGPVALPHGVAQAQRGDPARGRYRQPLILLKIRIQEFISGRHDLLDEAAGARGRAAEASTS